MSANLQSREDLIRYIAEGNVVKYLFFWGHTKKPDCVVGQECLSQWYEAAFVLEGTQYKTAEHYMMAEKARLFDDAPALEKIINSIHPADAKKIGRSVKNYNDKRWKQHRLEIVVRGNVAKISQNHDLNTFLMDTAQRVLVEASPRDRIWGIGLGKSNPKANDPVSWRGLNLLGFALMQTRDNLVSKNCF